MVKPKPDTLLNRTVHFVPDFSLGNVANLLAILALLIGGATYVSTIDAKVNNNTGVIAANDARNNKTINDLAAAVEARRIEDKADLTKQLDRIERKVDRLQGNPP